MVKKNENTKIVSGRVNSDLAETWKFFCDHIMCVDSQTCIAAALRHFMMSDKDMHDIALFSKASKVEDFNLEVSDLTRYKASPSQRLINAARGLLANHPDLDQTPEFVELTQKQHQGKQTELQNQQLIALLQAGEQAIKQGKPPEALKQIASQLNDALKETPPPHKKRRRTTQNQ